MRPIDKFLDSQITEKKLLLEKLNAIILPLLPEVSRSHIKTTSYNKSNQELVLIVDSPVWAARLRTQHKAISSRLQKELNFPVNSFKIKFQQPVQHKAKPKKPLPELSSDSAKLIRQTANSIEDEELKKSLLRLSKHTHQ
jgi:hypothetical protein